MATTEPGGLCCTRTPLLTQTVAAANPLDNLPEFLPAGTTCIPVRQRIPSQSHVSRYWHSLSDFSYISSIVEDSDNHYKLLDALAFLCGHHFIRATCRLGYGSWQSNLFFRIYLIPYDLSNVQGKLRVRNETTILTPARHHLRVLLAHLVQDLSEWELSEGGPSICGRKPFFTPSTDDRTMAELYTALPSPIPNRSLPFTDAILHGTIVGLRSELHTYQRHSVAAMLTKEIAPPSNADPLYIQITGLDGTVFYLQPATLEVLSEQPFVQPTKGGILCEELGTGKTVMILALIAFTTSYLSTPQESLQDERPVLTPVALNSFPFSPYTKASQQFYQVVKLQKFKATANSTIKIPSLKDILVHYLNTQPYGFRLQNHKSELRDRQLLKEFKQNIPFYLHYQEEALDPIHPRRGRIEKKPRVMYLTAATLIIVPVNLLYQWEMEINKHCEESLKFLVVRDTKPLSPAFKLATKYDIILMSHKRFSLEARKDSLEKLHTWKACKCPSSFSPQLPFVTCQCHYHESVSPLFQVCWKRLVIDKGHVASSTTSELVTLAKKLSVEFRWIVTGTPTTNLMGLQFGGGSELQYPEDENIPQSPYSDSNDSFSQELSKPGRVWTKADRQDLKKFSHMITDFLQVPQFALNQKLFTTHVIEPLMCMSGPIPGAIQVLTQVMESIMIRHQTSDVEKDVLLPFIHHETVLLDLDPYAVKTYNVMQAAVAINAIDSERVDQDYLFHPRNVAHLQQTVENMSQALFWQVDDQIFGIEDSLKDTEGFLNRVAARGHEQDLVLLRGALTSMQLAYEDPVWRELMCHPNVFQRVVSMPPEVYSAWTPLPPTISFVTDPHDIHYFLCQPEYLTQLRSRILTRPLLDVEHLKKWGTVVLGEEQLRQQNLASRVKDASKRNKVVPEKNVKLKELAMTSPEKLKQIREELADVQEQAREGNQLNITDSPSPLLARSPLAKTRLRNTTSSKLNYIINDVLLYSRDEKFLIFSRSPLTLAYITEALNVIGVRHLHFTSKVDLKTREQYVTTFETSHTFRVFLMELKHGARGLNLVSASRVIFCEPVWYADVEMQAIKRVHRIGQTRPVIVKTLAIRSTFEETMVSRSAALRSGSQTSGEKSLDLVDDRTMRDYLANPTFLPQPPLPMIQLDIAFLGEAAAEGSNQTSSPDKPTARKPSRYMPGHDDYQESEDDFRKRKAESSGSASMDQGDPTQERHKKPRLGIRFEM